MEFPPLGLGTMGIDDPETVATAVEVGYRHLDTAQIYENEAVVGEGLAAASVDRDEVLLATKVWADSLAYEDVIHSTTASLDRLGVGSVDLLYVHRPIETYDPADTLPAFEQLYDRGLIDAVGLSNFERDDLEAARDTLSLPVAAHQVEFHPFFQPRELLADAREHDTTLVAYSPLAGGRVFEDETIREIADAHDTDPATVTLAWLTVKEGVVAIPKASTPAHLRANLVATDLDLTAEERERIDALDRGEELFPE